MEFSLFGRYSRLTISRFRYVDMATSTCRHALSMPSAQTHLNEANLRTFLVIPHDKPAYIPLRRIMFGQLPGLKLQIILSRHHLIQQVHHCKIAMQ